MSFKQAINHNSSELICVDGSVPGVQVKRYPGIPLLPLDPLSSSLNPKPPVPCLEAFTQLLSPYAQAQRWTDRQTSAAAAPAGLAAGPPGPQQHPPEPLDTAHLCGASVWADYRYGSNDRAATGGQCRGIPE